jgi:hypothetical protein
MSAVYTTAASSARTSEGMLGAGEAIRAGGGQGDLERAPGDPSAG